MGVVDLILLGVGIFLGTMGPLISLLIRIPAVVLAETIDADTTWESSVLLSEQVFVATGAELRIRAGTTIRAASVVEEEEEAASLVVLPGASIRAEGTASSPITFTTTNESTKDLRGLWGGVLVLGNAPVRGGVGVVEGLRGGYSYGGSNATESSGVLRYVRVWYGGSIIGEDNEINGLTLAGVGSGTVVEHCEVAFSVDDGLEMFGGTVNLKWISVLFAGDDAIDIEDGYQGKIQFAYVMIGSGGHHGLESDSDSTPRSFPQIYSVTFVHSLDGSPTSVSSDDLRPATLRLRNGTGGEFGNLIITNVPKLGVLLTNCTSQVQETHDLPPNNSSLSSYLWFSSQNIIFGAEGIASYARDESCARSSSFGTAANVDPELAFMPGETDEDSECYDPRPVFNGPAFEEVDLVPSEWFEPVAYKGAFDRAAVSSSSSSSSSWLEPWSWLAETGRLNETTPVQILAENTRWSRNVALDTQLFVAEGVTLTIDAGVSVFAERTKCQAVVVVVLPGAKIEARGTATDPITFTSSANETSLPDRGLWGGLIVMGNAPVYGTAAVVEGLRGSYAFGGNDANDSSGVLEYVRVWYGGNVIGRNDEINGITLAGVGAGTTIQHCEVAFNLDDGIEIFGGTVNLKYVSVLFSRDDAIDIDLGYQGKIQFVYVMLGERGNHALEVDANFDSSPRSFFQLYSATFVHYLRDENSADSSAKPTVKIRDGAGGELGNIILVNVPNVGVQHLDCRSERVSQEEEAAPVVDTTAYLWVSPRIIVHGAPGIAAFEQLDSCVNLTAALLVDPQLALVPSRASETSAVDPRPNRTGYAYRDVDALPANDDGFFSAVDYSGAFGDFLWNDEWSWLAENGNLPPANCLDDERWFKRDEPSKSCAWVTLFSSQRCAVEGTDDRLASEACLGACGCTRAPSSFLPSSSSSSIPSVRPTLASPVPTVQPSSYLPYPTTSPASTRPTTAAAVLTPRPAAAAAEAASSGGLRESKSRGTQVPNSVIAFCLLALFSCILLLARWRIDGPPFDPEAEWNRHVRDVSTNY